MLLAAGHPVDGIDCLLPDLYPNREKIRRLRGLETYRHFTHHLLDLRVDNIDRVVERADSILHFAAMAGFAKSSTHLDLYRSCNVLATERLLSAIVRSGNSAHLVHASTSSVYGAFAVGGEALPLSPISPYGVTKLEAEEVVRWYESRYGLSATVLRYFSVYGPRQRQDMAYSKFCRALLRNKEFVVNGDGSQRRSNTFVDDACRAAILAADRAVPTAATNICGGESTGLLDALEQLATAIGLTARLRFRPPVPGDQITTAGSSARARDLLGWTESVKLKDGLTLQAQAAMLDSQTRDDLALSRIGAK